MGGLNIAHPHDRLDRGDRKHGAKQRARPVIVSSTMGRSRDPRRVQSGELRQRLPPVPRLVAVRGGLVAHELHEVAERDVDIEDVQAECRIAEVCEQRSLVGASWGVSDLQPGCVA